MSAKSHRRVSDDTIREAVAHVLSVLYFEMEYARLSRTPVAVTPVNPGKSQPRVLYAGCNPAQEPNFACFSQVSEELRSMKPISRNKPAAAHIGRSLALMFACVASGEVSRFYFDDDVRAVKLCTQPKLELRLEDDRHGYIVVVKETFGWVLRNANAYGACAVAKERHRIGRRLVPRSGAYRIGAKAGAI